MMTRSYKWCLRIPLLGGVVLGLAMIGCVTQDPFQPPIRGEIPDGPGLFTGSKGAWVISRNIGTRQVQTGGDESQVVKPSVPQATPSVSPSVPKASPSTPATSGRKPPPM